MPSACDELTKYRLFCCGRIGVKQLRVEHFGEFYDFIFSDGNAVGIVEFSEFEFFVVEHGYGVLRNDGVRGGR